MANSISGAWNRTSGYTREQGRVKGTGQKDRVQLEEGSTGKRWNTLSVNKKYALKHTKYI